MEESVNTEETKVPGAARPPMSPQPTEAQIAEAEGMLAIRALANIEGSSTSSKTRAYASSVLQQIFPACSVCSARKGNLFRHRRPMCEGGV
jgi:hypothetical protein